MSWFSKFNNCFGHFLDLIKTIYLKQSIFISSDTYWWSLNVSKQFKFCVQHHMITLISFLIIYEQVRHNVYRHVQLILSEIWIKCLRKKRFQFPISSSSLILIHMVFVIIREGKSSSKNSGHNCVGKEEENNFFAFKSDPLLVRLYENVFGGFQNLHMSSTCNLQLQIEVLKGNLSVCLYDGLEMTKLRIYCTFQFFFHGIGSRWGNNTY